MKKRIRLCFLLVNILSLILFMAAAIYGMDKRNLALSRNHLDNLLQASVSLTEESPDNWQEYIKNLAKGLTGDIRVTVIDSRGNVLADSRAVVDNMENHFSRKEISEAFYVGYGFDTRTSGTRGVQTLYVARTLNPDIVFRFSTPISEARNLTKELLPLFIIALICVFIIGDQLVNRLAKKIIKPFEILFDYMKNSIQKKETEPLTFFPYEELAPVTQCFTQLMDETKVYIDSIQEKTNEIENIISSMEEGLILLDDNMEIIIINERSKTFLQIGDAADNRIDHLYRNEKFKAHLHILFSEHTPQLFDLDENNLILRISMNPVTGGGYSILITDITEIVQLSQMRSEFTSNVTHELKTPLTSISGFAELISMDMVTDPAQIKNYTSKILLESKRLIRLVDDILELSQIENGQHDTDPEDFDLKEIFYSVFDLLSHQIEEKNLSYTVQGGVAFCGSRRRMHELIFNLVENAIKYNKPHGSIAVNLFQSETESGFSVKDTGIGIPKEQQDRIFERFYRVDKARSRKEDGTGLGLSIAKHIVENLNGAIQVESTAESTVFTVTLPK